MKKLFLIVGVVALLALLGGAAFVGAQLLAGPSASVGPEGGLLMKTSQGGTQQTYKLQTIPAKELPQESAVLKGIFLRRQDSSIFVGTGQVQMRASKNPDGTIAMSSSHDGPDVEIIFTHDTIVFQDVTMSQFEGKPPSETPMQQVVEPGSMDEIGQDSMVMVWGERRGDRVVATTVVFSPSALLIKAGSGK